MAKELLKFEITEALVKVQVESALALSFSNRGETEALAAHARRAKKASIISSSSFENIKERSMNEQNNTI